MQVDAEQRVQRQRERVLDVQPEVAADRSPTKRKRGAEEEAEESAHEEEAPVEENRAQRQKESQRTSTETRDDEQAQDVSFSTPLRQIEDHLPNAKARPIEVQELQPNAHDGQHMEKSIGRRQDQSARYHPEEHLSQQVRQHQERRQLQPVPEEVLQDHEANLNQAQIDQS